MLAGIKAFFDKNFPTSSDPAGHEHSLKLASTALLVEMLRMDDHISEDEKKALFSAVSAKFDLSDNETQEIISLAEEELKNSTDYYQFTSLINSHFEYPDKVHIIELLWQIAFADDHLDRDEEYLVRKISELIYVSHADFIATKIRVQSMLDS